MRLPSGLLGLAAALAVTAGPLATRSEALGNAIHACYGRSDQNELHVTAAGRPCPPGEKSLTWNKHAGSKRGGTTLFGVSVTTGHSTTVNNRNPTINAGNSKTSIGSRRTSVGDTTTSSTQSGNSHDNHDNNSKSFTQWLDDASSTMSSLSSTLGNGLLVFGFGVLSVSLLLIPLTWLFGLTGLRRRPWRLPFLRWLGPRLQIRPFDDSGMPIKIGASFATQTQARLADRREAGRHLYLVTGDQAAEGAVAAMQGVPQTQALAAALSTLTLAWSRTRLIVDGSLTPVDDRGAAALALTLRRNTKVVDTTEIWPSHQTSGPPSPARYNRVLTIAAAGWIEHAAADQTPGPRAFEAFLSNHPKSWALFRAGAELSRISHLDEAADYYERALALDPKNVAALVDLAHLRRRDGNFEGAQILALSAIDLIDARAKDLPLSTKDDPDWYRARIVLATTCAEWAKELEAEGDETDATAKRTNAFDRALETANAAITARARIEGLLSMEALRSTTLGGKLRRRARRDAQKKAKEEGWHFDPDRAVEFHDLLRTTFEPGALLIMAANCDRRAESPPEERPNAFAASNDDIRRAEIEKRERETREKVSEQLLRKRNLDPHPLIEHLNVIPNKAPRVLYNLACYYSMAAAEESNTTSRKRDLDIAAEYLRQGISRTPPLERRSLLERTMVDPDLRELVRARRPGVRKLWKLVPEPPRRVSATL